MKIKEKSALKKGQNPPTLATRSAGILLHPTSLPGHFGAGDLGPAAYEFADALQRAGLRWWQMLPITPPGPGPEYSPYSSLSGFAGSPWLVSPELLHRDGLLSKSELADARQPAPGRAGSRIDFAEFRTRRLPVLRHAFGRLMSASSRLRNDFQQFAQSDHDLLDDYALFAAIKESQHDMPWSRWPNELRLRIPEALAAARKTLANSISFHQFIQWLFNRQWTSLKRYCNQSGVGLIGDIPIFVAYDSAPVWAQRRLFLLDSAGNPTALSGYPPDDLATLGQVWGHPHYRWSAHIADGFSWWTARFKRMLEQFDAIRIDHFLGFHRVWSVPAGAKNAKKGRWLNVPGDRLFAAVRKHLGDIPIIAEDLGNQTPQAIQLRDKFKFPGMRIIQFAFGDSDYHLPHVYPKASVAYTGTHDNQTLVGWFNQLKASSNGELKRALAYVGDCDSETCWNFIRVLFASPAQTVIVPVQDVLGLGAEHRMNIPGILRGNWGWRMAGPLPEQVLRRLRDLSEATHRI